uniref:Alanine--tRNA ligase n=4 Tax=Ditylum brightwellii TaxID=49249 RepID=A0A7S1YSQ0_9STRA|mmetsp:Transcript_1657/g.2686  ORF Transcript_1657/g.2686 Transcript_1657/m.2686 type:complete len:1034 (+) Transcript_1657:199-3300(+)
MRLPTVSILFLASALSSSVAHQNNNMIRSIANRHSQPLVAFAAHSISSSGTRTTAGRLPFSLMVRPMASTATEEGEKETEELKWSTDKVRSTFVDFFASSPRDHTIQPSSPSAPLNDPTLLFANAGMNQFKPIFLGQTDPNSPLASLKRATNSQKCIRAGGKHNDLEDVGRDTYHHTFFEMLGSWSFGDYFKKEAVDYAWELLVDVYGLQEDRLYATYFGGDEKLGLEPDLEAKEYWEKYLPADRVLACDAKDNFWEMGDTGPCGPCSEIHYDRIGNRDASALVNADDPDVIEIWNIVFIQFNRDENGLASLPSKHIDTGMGLERLVSILQDKTSNYDIDAFAPIFRKIEEHSKVGPYGGLVLEDDTTLRDTAYRAIADHARALSFALADGAVPNNEGRGYVLRRILRRATRYGQQILKAEPGFFATLIPVVVDTFGEAYPELVKNQDTILEIVKEEEEAFSTMLDRGIKFFTELESELKEEGKKQVTGDKAFFLYDTLGFPIDLTELMAEEAGLTVDSDGFTNEMEAQKQRSRDARAKAKGGGTKRLEFIAEQTAWLAENGVKATDDSSKYAWDVETAASIKAVFGTDGFLEEGSSVGSGETVGIVLDKSSFYAEAGGQEADLGTLVIQSEDGDVVGKFIVMDVQTYGGFLLHTGTIEEGEIKVGASVKCKVDYDRRRDVAPNHSMTHVLNAALREVLGDGVEQRGSLCNDEKLRFDFSHKKAMTAKQLRQTEEIVAKSIADAEQVTSEVMPLAEAQEIDGVRAVFGEVYPDPVRVVSVGSDTSVEFCGGTHVSNTAEAEAFVLVEETAVAKGIRRITGVTKGAAIEAIAEGKKFVEIVSSAEELSADTPELDKKAGAMRKDLDAAFMSAPLKAELRARIEAIQKKGIAAKKAALAGRVDQVLKTVKEDISAAVAEGKRALVLNVDICADSKAAQKVMNDVKSVAPDMAFMGLSEEEAGSGGKLMCFAVVPDSLVADGFKADAWVRAALESCGGRGGGKPGSAQGQAQECSDVDAVIAVANEFANESVGATA